MSKIMVNYHKLKIWTVKILKFNQSKTEAIMGNQSIQRKVKYLTKSDQKEIMWDIILEFRQIVVAKSSCQDVHQLQMLFLQAQNLRNSIVNITELAGDYFDAKVLNSLHKTLGIIDDFLDQYNLIISNHNLKHDNVPSQYVV